MGSSLREAKQGRGGKPHFHLTMKARRLKSASSDALQIEAPAAPASGPFSLRYRISSGSNGTSIKQRVGKALQRLLAKE